MNEFRQRLWGVLVLASVAYVLGYWLLMVRDLRSVDSSGEFEFRSSSRIGPGVTVNHGISILHGRTSVLNYVFYPADVAYYAITDACKRKQNRG